MPEIHTALGAITNAMQSFWVRLNETTTGSKGSPQKTIKLIQNCIYSSSLEHVYKGTLAQRPSLHGILPRIQILSPFSITHGFISKQW